MSTLSYTSLVLFVDDYHNEQDFLELGDAFLSNEVAQHYTLNSEVHI